MHSGSFARVLAIVPGRVYEYRFVLDDHRCQRLVSTVLRTEFVRGRRLPYSTSRTSPPNRRVEPRYRDRATRSRSGGSQWLWARNYVRR